MHSTPSYSYAVPPNRTWKSRCVKSISKDASGGGAKSSHIEINSAALEASLREYSTDVNELTPSDTIKFSNSQSSTPLLPAIRNEDEEKDDGWDQTPTERTTFTPHKQSWEGSLASSIGQTANFDLIALIPPSALPPYMPQIDLTLELFNVYFLELPSAKLMFDQRSVLHRYRDSTLPNQILFSILAIASL